MYEARVRSNALTLLGKGLSVNAVSRELGVSRAAIRAWRDLGPLAVAGAVTDCFRCASEQTDNTHAYALLLGLYLGDGCLSRHRGDVFSLRIACDAKYAGVIDEVAQAIGDVRARAKVFYVPAPGVVVVQAYWKHWPCLFPQHGPGRKHERPIILEPWQQAIVRAQPEALLRGLFRSDGCRITNWTVRPLKAGPKRYEYPRYMFSNESADIIGICTAALDQLEISWTLPRRNLLSVARKDAVARLDTFIGPKA